MDFHGGGGPAEKPVLRAKGFFIDPAFKSMELHIFDNKMICPVNPLYNVLIGSKIIFPFQSVLKNKEWAALPFENDQGIKQTEI